MIIHRSRLPSVWSSSRMQYVAADKSALAPGSWTSRACQSVVFFARWRGGGLTTRILSGMMTWSSGPGVEAAVDAIVGEEGWVWGRRGGRARQSVRGSFCSLDWENDCFLVPPCSRSPLLFFLPPSTTPCNPLPPSVPTLPARRTPSIHPPVFVPPTRIPRLSSHRGPSLASPHYRISIHPTIPSSIHAIPSTHLMNHLAPPHSTPSPPTSISPTTLSRSYFSRPSSHSSHIPSSKPNHRQRDPSHLTIGRLQPRSTHYQNHTHILSARTARELEIIRSSSRPLPPPQSLKLDLAQDHSWSFQLGQTRPRHARGNNSTESRVRQESGASGVEYRVYETVTVVRTQPSAASRGGADTHVSTRFDEGGAGLMMSE